MNIDYMVSEVANENDSFSWITGHLDGLDAWAFTFLVVVEGGLLTYSLDEESL